MIDRHRPFSDLQFLDSIIWGGSDWCKDRLFVGFDSRFTKTRQSFNDYSFENIGAEPFNVARHS
jgi:hypothetical protein